MNSTFAVLPSADVLFAGDFAWWRQYGAHARAVCTGEFWTTSPRARDTYGINFVRGVRNPDQAKARGNIFSGVNSGHNAVALAHLFGVARVVLLGFDMSFAPDGRRHHHADHPAPMGNGGHFAKWCSQFAVFAHCLQREGVAVVNASRVTALRCFPRASLAEALP